VSDRGFSIWLGVAPLVNLGSWLNFALALVALAPAVHFVTSG